MSHWVIIETGSNQSFVFATNMQRVNVGASHLIRECGTTWVRDAAANESEVRIVVAASGSATLLVADVASGQRIIETVTRRAAETAPGLDVWGVVDPQAAEPEYPATLGRAHRLHGEWRYRRPSAALRSPMMPWTQPCALTGGAASVERSPARDQSRSVSRAVAAAWDAGPAGRAHLEDTISPHGLVPVEELNEGIVDRGWVAVVHADGNGIGQIFRELGKYYRGEDYLLTLAAFSEQLDYITQLAFSEAAADVQRSADTDRWLLPLVVGGDDVTALAGGRMGIDLAAAYLGHFASLSADDTLLSEIAGKMLNRPGLSAAAGVAIVKPHHPFSDAYALAESLCVQAKAASVWEPGSSALDFHVLRGSLGTSVKELRSTMTTRLKNNDDARLWSGPHVVMPQAETLPAGSAAAEHHLDVLTGARVALSRQQISGTAVHRLRDGLVRGGAELESVLAGVDPKLRDLVLTRDSDGAFSRLLDAVELNDVAGSVA